MEGLRTYINARQLGLQVFEIPEQQAEGAMPAAPAQPVINNDLVMVTPVLLRAAVQQQVSTLLLTSSWTSIQSLKCWTRMHVPLSTLLAVCRMQRVVCMQMEALQLPTRRQSPSHHINGGA